MKNIYMTDLTHDYYVDIAKSLVSMGARVTTIGASPYPEYWPSSLDGFIASQKSRVILMEDFNFPELFDRILDPDYSVLTPQVLKELAYYEKMFLLSTDRLAFVPIPQIDRCRLFYRFVGHFYKIIREDKIDAVVLFGIPHGLAAIALFGLAKALKLDALYVDWAGLASNLSTIETEMKPRRSYTPQQMELGLVVDKDGLEAIHTLVQASVHKDTNMNPPKPKNRLKFLLRAVGSLMLRSPLDRYISPEFFLNPGGRRRISYAWPLIRYHMKASRAIAYYDRHATTRLPDENSLVLFLHFQPEAITMPQGGIYADQLLVLDLILAALPEGMNIVVKEHPFMFDQFAQDNHERSVEFYQHMLRDPRVRFIDKSVSSRVLLDKARLFASTNGTISWEAMRTGKPCIIFGWSWFSPCDSCFVADSVDSLRDAIDAASRKTPDGVLADVQAFLTDFEKRLIHAVPWRFALDYVEEKGFRYEDSVTRLAKAIAVTLELDGIEKSAESNNPASVREAAVG